MTDLHLRSELTALADSMPDHPDRVAAVVRRARRRRRQHVGARSVAATACLGLAAVGLAYAGGGTDDTSLAAEPGGTAAPMASDPAPMATPDAAATPPKCPGPGEKGAEVDSKIKGIGTIVAAPSPDSITVGDLGDESVRTTITVDPATELLVTGAPTTARPALQVGDPVAYLADRDAAGAWHAVLIDVRPVPPQDEVVASTDGPVERPAGAPDEGGVVARKKGIGTVVALPAADAVTVRVAEPAPGEDATFTIVADTRFGDGGRVVDRPALVVGDQIAFSARSTDGAWEAEDVQLHPELGFGIGCGDAAGTPRPAGGPAGAQVGGAPKAVGTGS